MNNAVIYARYSSTGQNEQSIEGQVRICKEFAQSRGFNVVKTYIDKAKTGTNDQRPDFQKMIRDAESGAFQYVLVYMFDRFARNRIDSIIHKQQLKERFGIKVLSALEPVSDDEGGEFYEMYLEWNAEKYSKRLSKRVRDGLDTSVTNGTFCGGYLIYGYKKHKEPVAGKNERYIKTVVVDEEKAELVRYVFKEYARGMAKKDIAAALNAQGHRYNGKPFLGRMFDKWLVNEKYTGVFTFGGRVCDNMYPAIIDRGTYERAQQLLKKNKYFAKSNTPREPYLLTSKLYCGHCGTPMVSDGGVGKMGVTYHYYVCKTARKKDCRKYREYKDKLEFEVAQMTVDYFKDKRRIAKVADDVISHYERKTDASDLKSLAAKIAAAKKDMDDTTTAYIQAVATKNGLFETSCQKRMAELAALLDDLQNQHARLEIQRGYRITREDIISFVEEFTDGDAASKAFQKRVIDNLVNSVYIYDEKTVIYFNIKGGKDMPFIGKDETDALIQKEPEHESSDSVPTGGTMVFGVEPLIVNGNICLVFWNS